MKPQNKILPSDVYVGLITRVSPPLIIVNINGFLGFAPSFENWHPEFKDVELSRLFEKVAEGGFPAGIRFFGVPGVAIAGKVPRTRNVLITKIISEPHKTHPMKPHPPGQP